MAKTEVAYGLVQSTEEIGRMARAHRKDRGLTLETVSGLGNLSTRFLSEFERGKETAEIGKVLKALRILGLDVVVQPRVWSRRFPTGIDPAEWGDFIEDLI